MTTGYGTPGMENGVGEEGRCLSSQAALPPSGLSPEDGSQAKPAAANAEGRRPTLTWEALKITPRQKAKALLAGRLAEGANVLLELGQIDRERHTEILKILAPDLKPVVNAMVRVLERKSDEGGKA